MTTMTRKGFFLASDETFREIEKIRHHFALRGQAEAIRYAIRRLAAQVDAPAPAVQSEEK